MKISRVSVILATYNGAHLLGPTLQSLDDQNLETMMVSICDDASTDETYDVVTSWAKKTRHEVVMTRNSSNTGPSMTFEKAMFSVSTDYLIILGQDDTLEPEHVTNLLSIASSKEEVAAVMPMNSNASLSNRVKSTARNLITGGDPNWAAFIRLLGGNPFFAPGTLLRREYWRPSIMHPANMQAQDFELWLHLAMCGRLIQSKQRVKYGIHANNLHNCDPLDEALDVGLTLRRLLESVEFNSLRSKLEQSDRQALDLAVLERLTEHARINPLTYEAATLNTSWQDNGILTNHPLKDSLSDLFMDSDALLNLNFKLRSQLLDQLREYYLSTSNFGPNNGESSKSSSYHRRVSLWLNRVNNERKANQRVKHLPSPWAIMQRNQE